MTTIHDVRGTPWVDSGLKGCGNVLKGCGTNVRECRKTGAVKHVWSVHKVLLCVKEKVEISLAESRKEPLEGTTWYFSS